MLTEIDATDAPLSEFSSASSDIEVRRAPAQETFIVGAAMAWAQALEAKQHKRTASGDGQTAELALYDALADADALRRAERALYRAVLASGLISK
jgi:hypothetical protein